MLDMTPPSFSDLVQENARLRDENFELTEALSLSKGHEQLARESYESLQIHSTRLESTVKSQTIYVEFYKAFQDSITKNPTLLDEWQRFCVMLKLTDPDQEKYDVIREKSLW